MMCFRSCSLWLFFSWPPAKCPVPALVGTLLFGGGNPLLAQTPFLGLRTPFWPQILSQSLLWPPCRTVCPSGSAIPNNLVKTSLEPPAEGADDVCGGPSKCGGGRVWEAAAVCCRSTPSFLPSLGGHEF